MKSRLFRQITIVGAIGYCSFLFPLFSQNRVSQNQANALDEQTLLAKKLLPKEAKEQKGHSPKTLSPKQTLDYFIKQAYLNNPRYKAEQHLVEEAKKINEGETIIADNPMFSFGYMNVPVGSFPSLNQDPMSSMGFMLSQKIAMPTESESRFQMARQEFISRSEKFSEMGKRLKFQVTDLFHQLNFLYLKRKLLIQSKEALTNIISVARAMVSVNKMHASNLLKLEAGLSQMESEIEEAQALISRTESSMEEITLVKPQESQIGAWKKEPSQIVLLKEFNYKNHPAYKQAEAMLKKAEANKAHEGAKYFPSLTFSAEYMLRQATAKSMGEDMITLKITAPLPLFFPIKQSKAVQAADEHLKAARQNLEQASLSLMTTWKGEYEMAQKMLQVYQRYHEDTLPKYYAAYKAQLGGLSSGTISLLDVLDAYRMYLAVSIKEAQVYRNLQKSLATLEYLSSAFGNIQDKAKDKPKEAK